MIEHYRCPEGCFDFGLADEVAEGVGFFRFGGATCYGRSSSGAAASSLHAPLYDALHGVSIAGEQLRIPFNPTEVIDNLRLERYASALGAGGKLQSILRKTYYQLRPLTNQAIRKRVQAFRVRNWKKLSFPHWPLDTSVEDISEQLLLLSMQAKGVDRVPFVWFWPDSARGCMTMTHDVETEAGKNFCSALMDVDDRFGMKACFNVVPEGRYAVTASFLESIRRRGFEVGIQDLNHDGRLFDNRQEFLRRAGLINNCAKQFGARGFRAGVLYRKPEWYGALDFSFDMSIPNVAHLDPQRGGCCTVMPYFIGNMLELPVTTTQDYMLFHLLKERSISLWKEQVERILARNGLASFIVHPDYVMEPDTMPVYRDLLQHLRDIQGVWFALPSEIDDWWRARSGMRVEGEGNSWRVAGKGSERATLAYARNVDGKLVYELAS